MKIDYNFEKTITAKTLQSLLHQTGWAKNRNVESIQKLLDNSLCIGAWDGNQLVGFARAITDDVYRAFIEDVIVEESYRGEGIGRGLIEALLDQLKHIEQIILCCEDHNIAFYEKFEFKNVEIQFMQKWQG